MVYYTNSGSSVLGLTTSNRYEAPKFLSVGEPSRELLRHLLWARSVFVPMDTLGMTSIGEKLRRERLQKGVTLDQVATQTKIGLRLLEAIEAEQFDKLPGGVFRRSFVLQYARALGLDQDAIANEMKHLHSFDEEVHLPGQDMPVPDVPPLSPPRDWRVLQNSFGSLVWVFVVIVCCAGVYMGFQNWSSGRSGSTPEPVVEASQKREPAPPPVSTPVQPPAQTTQAESQTPNPAATSPARSAEQPATPASPAPTQTPAAPPPEPADLKAQIAASTKPVRVGLTAGEDTWLQITQDGKRIFSDTLKPNETKFIEADGVVRILTGNAGGLSVSLNGRTLEPIGPHGQIRVIELRPEGVQAVPRTPVAPLADPF